MRKMSRCMEAVQNRDEWKRVGEASIQEWLVNAYK